VSEWPDNLIRAEDRPILKCWPTRAVWLANGWSRPCHLESRTLALEKAGRDHGLVVVEQALHVCSKLSVALAQRREPGRSLVAGQIECSIQLSVCSSPTRTTKRRHGSFDHNA
jgi:hypothetical protein